MALMRRKEGVRGVLEERGELSVRPAWWREFLQKVKMFFYGFKGFSNYRFTDKEIETLLLRGYRKTRSARGAKAEGGDARFAALRREGAPNTADKPGQMRDSHVPHEEGFMEKYRFGGKGLYADYEFLYGRHPEYFEDVEHARAAVEFVLAQPEEAGNIRDNLAFVREDQSTGKVYRVEINPKIIGKRCQIRSVHEITQTQYKKIKDRTARGDSASPDSVRHEQEFKASEHPNMKTSDPSEKATAADFLRYDSTENGKVKHALEDGSDFSDGADKYTLENAKASKEGYRVERVNENAGRDLTEAQGVVCEVNQVFNPEEAPEGQFIGWMAKKVKAYEKAHPLTGSYNTPALGKNVEVRKSTIRSISNHGGPDEKFNLYPAVPDMLHNAVLIQSEANIDENTQAIRSYSHILASKVRYGEKRFVAIMVIHESDRICYYDYSILLIDNGALQMPEEWRTGKKKAAENGSPATAGPSSHTAQVLKVAREALLSSGFDTKSEKNLRFSIEQYSDADWSDMVTYMRSKVGNVLNHPDSDYRRMLEEAGMRCYSDADAHACAAEAMQQNEREIRKRGEERRDKWIYENELLYRQVVDFAGSDKFTLVPDSFTGEKFTGTWIAEEYRKYSEKRAQKPKESDKQYKRYLQTREKALARAKGVKRFEFLQIINKMNDTAMQACAVSFTGELKY